MEKICVAVRVRPPVNDDSSAGAYWKVDDNRISLQRSLGTPISGVSYAFDYVFDQDCTNERVYELLTKDIINAAVEGFNGTAFAYGQTSSGKTFTMNGSENDPGIIHRSVKDIFTKIQMATDREFLIRVSYMEIYNEEINDLFAVENQKLQIHESLDRGIFVAGLREEIVNSAEQVLKLIESGEVNRHFGETNMNVRSSRSHTIFRMVIESKGKLTGSTDCSSLDDAIRVSVLNLVDLAGSERIAKTGAGGVRLKEGKHINKSLMILGNVINKLSDGGKQRGHIPYRDSKLTRILQPALGGNAKTSIICTVAPEEVHVEETKGTLQFASRAKKITNCVQVNEILTDAALLKRQKLEIEELREKLQGSRAEVLEQEILKLRNDMLKYELEHEKLAMELEEERKSHKERDQCIKEQQMKINNLSSLVTSSGSDRVPSQIEDPASQSLKEESSESQSVFREEAFETPRFKAAPNAFVVKRSDYSTQLDYTPFPDTHSNIADEDTWLKMNKGFVADLDSLHITPARKVQSFPFNETTPVSNENYKLEVQNLRRQLELSLKEKNDLEVSTENYKLEIQNLRRQLELALKENNDFERTHAEQSLLNKKLMGELSELQQEAALVREVPRKLLESVVDCSDIYKDIISTMQSFTVDDRSSNPELFACSSEIGARLFSTLENQFSSYTDGEDTSVRNEKLIQEECERVYDRFKSIIKSIMLSEEPMKRSKLSINLPCSEKNKDCTLGRDITFLKQKLGSDISTIVDNYQSLEKELESSTQLLEMSKERYHSLEMEFCLLKEERDSLLQTVNSSSQRLTQLTDQKERVLLELNCEFQRRKDLQEEMKKFGAAFECRQKSLMSFHSEFKSRIENLKAQNQVSIPKPLRY